MILCVIPSDNHSADQVHLNSGRNYSIPVCWFHESQQFLHSEVYREAERHAKLEVQWIVYTEDHEGNISASLKKTRRAAVIAYNKLTRTDTGQFKTYGYSYANDAYPNERQAAGLIPFPKLNIPL